MSPENGSSLSDNGTYLNSVLRFFLTNVAAKNLYHDYHRRCIKIVAQIANADKNHNGVLAVAHSVVFWHEI